MALIKNIKVGSAIKIGNDLEILVRESKGQWVKLGIKASKDLEVSDSYEVFKRVILGQRIDPPGMPEDAEG